MVKGSVRLRRWAVGSAAVVAVAIVCAAICAVNAGAAVTSGPVVMTRGRASTTKPLATGAIATTTTQYLCAGPTVACPITGYVMPPYTPTLSMSYGQDWNGTVVVTEAAAGPAPPTGNIEITWSYNSGPAQVICTLPVASGGTCPSQVGTTEGTSLGTNTITASYTGDSNYAPSSSTVVITVLQDATAASLEGSPNPATAGTPVTLTASMTGSDAPPTGLVTYSYGGSVIGTGTLAPGSGFTSTATMTTSTLPVGADTITATYAGTPDFAGASATWVETVTPVLAGSFTLTVTPDPVTVGVGTEATLTVTVTSANGFAQDVTLSCGNLPQEATCVFGTPTIAGGSGATTLIVQTAAPHSCGTTTPYFYGRNGGGGLGLRLRGRGAAVVALAGLIALFVPVRRRRWLKLVVALAAIAGAVQMTGCGNCTDLGTRPATYSIEVTGTAADSSTTASQAVTVNVVI